MKDRPSFTASAVAAARGMAGIDPIAADLLGQPLASLVRASRLPGGRAAANLTLLGLVDHLEFRTRALDAAIATAVGAGTRQLVILGAGLDARAWRLGALKDTVVFEIDHPSTQRYKRERIAGRTALAREVRFAPVDFARDSLTSAMERAGHDAGAPTVWIWEGVTPYLDRDARRATLGAIASRSAAASTIAVTYATPPRSGGSLRQLVLQGSLPGFRWLGEPVVGLVSRDAMHAELEDAGFTVASDAAPRHALRFIPERVAVARKGS